MRLKKPLPLPVVICALALAVTTPAFAAAGTVDLAWLQKQTVQIKVERPGDKEGETKVDYGSGVVLCQDVQDGQVYILTAFHVLYGKIEGDRKPTYTDVVKTEILFLDNSARIEEKPAEGSRITRYALPDQDLLLLVAYLPKSTAHAEPRILQEAELQSRPDVLAIGYAEESKDREKGWRDKSGVLERREGIHLLHTAQLEDGFSGGPLFDAESGALLGINVSYSLRPEATPESPREGHAVPMDEVRNAMHRWAPKECFGPSEEDEKTAQALEIYKEGLREISLKNWPAAQKKMEAARDLRSLEGGSVHLQGMRYSVYLPYYHLGLAIYKQAGDDKEKYAEALRYFRNSEVQGAIHDNVRYRKMQKLMDRCREKLHPKGNAGENN